MDDLEEDAFIKGNEDYENKLKEHLYLFEERKVKDGNQPDDVMTPGGGGPRSQEENRGEEGAPHGETINTTERSQIEDTHEGSQGEVEEE